MSRNFKFRCSSLGLIMTDAQSIDEQFVTEEVAAIQRRTKRTDDEKALLQALKDKSLSAGAKTYIESLAKEELYGFREVVTGKYMDKGLIVEDESIELYNRVFFTDYVKNTERRTDDYITGECDIIVPGVAGIDIKSAWSLATFPATAAAGHDKLYEWQCRGYMRLWNVPAWEVAYCMVNTPDELIKYEQEELHYVDHIDPALRVTVVRYERDMELEAKIVSKVRAARQYFDRITGEIKRQHNVLEAA
ncbi:hypothetical protein [Massilia sp. X63]|uniref:hypothetical protein n=1 Tax=Massilia sp. X63 TaxID=3237285 RepID=UPI0034DCD286